MLLGKNKIVPCFNLVSCGLVGCLSFGRSFHPCLPLSPLSSFALVRLNNFCMFIE